jgi:hypothetical protein
MIYILAVTKEEHTNDMNEEVFISKCDGGCGKELAYGNIEHLRKKYNDNIDEVSIRETMRKIKNKEFGD